MKAWFKLFAICAGIIIFSSSCNDLNLEPESEPVIIDYNEYKPLIDSTFFKLWSDSTWEKFSRDTTIDGNLYLALINNTGKEYFYNTKFDLSGFKEKNDSLIIFNDPLTIPSYLTLNEVYTLQTAFRYQNINHIVVLKQTYSDTTSVSALSNTFSGCVIVKSSFQITTGSGDGVENEQLWLAKGLNAIKKVKNFRDTVYVLQAVINGKEWNSN